MREIDRIHTDFPHMGAHNYAISFGCKGIVLVTDTLQG